MKLNYAINIVESEELEASMATNKFNKEEHDKFYTNPEVAKKCIDSLGDLSKYDRIIEPSAGSGAFSKQIPNCEAYDLVPEDKSIKKQDFLKFKADKGNILVIGNPPFGRRSDLAIKFINKSAEFAKTIAMILPRTFARESVLKQLNTKVHLKKYDENLGKNAFLLNGKPYDVKCAWFVFDVKDVDRKVADKQSTNDFTFTTKDNADFAVLNKGWHIGRVLPDDTNISDACKFWIKSNINVNTLKKRFTELASDELKNYPLAHMTLTNASSLSKQELIVAYNKAFK